MEIPKHFDIETYFCFYLELERNSNFDNNKIKNHIFILINMTM